METSWVPGPALAWTLHTGCPAPCVLFSAVRGLGGELLDFEWAALNPAAEALVREVGLECALSRWAGVVEGIPGAEVLERVVETGQPHTCEVGCRPGGRGRWFRLQALKHGDGVALWLLEFTEAREALERERASEAHLRLALETARMVTWEWTQERRTVTWSPHAEAFFGRAPGELGHTLEEFLACVLPEEREQVAEAIEQGLRADGPYCFQFHGRWPDGRVRCYEAVGETFHEDGTPARMVGVVMDCTARARSLERMREEARFRERFIGVLGHDLRNPLNAIALSAKTVRRRYPHNPALQQVAQRIEASAARMGNMISDLLDLTRARLSGGIPLQPAPVRLPEVCRQVLEELRVVYPGRRMELEVEGEGEGLWDPERLAQVLSNLVGNALEHGQPEGTVYVRCREEQEQRVVEISNPGAPIPVHQLETLFDPFRQVGPVRSGRGSGLGLGLFIVREIVEAHGGRVMVRSTQQEGTTFTVLLPREASAAAVRPAEERHPA